jgi:hypothetical protein
MHCADRVIGVFARSTGEHRSSGLNLNEVEVERDQNAGLTARVHQRAQLGQAVEARSDFFNEAHIQFLREACLNLREPTIHEQFRSGDIATVVRREKHDGFGSLIGRSEPSERNAFGDHLLAFLAA